jgi:hypothetical protein
VVGNLGNAVDPVDLEVDRRLMKCSCRNWRPGWSCDVSGGSNEIEVEGFRMRCERFRITGRTIWISGLEIYETG